MLHNEDWEPTEGDARAETKARVESTGNEATYLVYEDQYGNKCFWVCPPNVNDTRTLSVYTDPPSEEIIGMKLIKNEHYSLGIIKETSGGKTTYTFIQGSVDDYYLSRNENCIVIHNSINLGCFVFDSKRITREPIFYQMSTERELLKKYYRPLILFP
jgi:hypothetical protein